MNTEETQPVATSVIKAIKINKLKSLLRLHMTKISNLLKAYIHAN